MQKYPIGAASDWVFCYNRIMGRDNFKRIMFNPYFQSEHYKESKGYAYEVRVEKAILRILSRLLFWKKSERRRLRKF